MNIIFYEYYLMPRFISKCTGKRIARPNGTALIKKNPSTASIGRSSTLNKKILSRSWREPDAQVLQTTLSKSGQETETETELTKE